MKENEKKNEKNREQWNKKLLIEKLRRKWDKLKKEWNEKKK